MEFTEKELEVIQTALGILISEYEGCTDAAGEVPVAKVLLERLTTQRK